MLLLCCCLLCGPHTQKTRASCPRPSDVLVLPFDLMDSTQTLQEVAKAADEAFGGAGVDFLVHNAGEGARIRCPAGAGGRRAALVLFDWARPKARGGRGAVSSCAASDCKEHAGWQWAG